MIALYRNGNKYKFKGVDCDIGRFKLHELDTRLNEGWKKSPLDLLNLDKKEEVEDKKKSAINNLKSRFKNAEN